MTNNQLNNWLATPPPPTESAACFHNAHDDCRDERCPCTCGHRFRNLLASFQRAEIIDAAIDRTNAEFAQVATVACVVAAILDVIDKGYQFKNHAKLCPWLFFLDESDEQTDLRGKFTDAVVQRIAELQAPPHKMDTRLLKLVHEDLAEMRRLTKERMER
jgi:hypothetical protein